MSKSLVRRHPVTVSTTGLCTHKSNPFPMSHFTCPCWVISLLLPTPMLKDSIHGVLYVYSNGTVFEQQMSSIVHRSTCLVNQSQVVSYLFSQIKQPLKWDTLYQELDIKILLCHDTTWTVSQITKGYPQPALIIISYPRSWTSSRILQPCSFISIVHLVRSCAY